MRTVHLKTLPHSIKVGQDCELKEPNIVDDSMFLIDNEIVGFYIRQMPEKACRLADLANAELRTKNVPKSEMERVKPLGIDETTGKALYDRSRVQYSTILGSIAPKSHMKRMYPNISSVHSKPSAQNFVKAMLLLCREAEEIIKAVAPSQFVKQMEALKTVHPKWKFGRLFTSSISNYNISAPFHRDTANIKHTVNAIITKRYKSSGGNLHVPDYDLTVDQCDNSLLVYPAWLNVHGVTPIVTESADGYRNSLVFYPLQAFENTADLS